MKRHSQKKSGLGNRGDSLIFAIGIVLLLFVITTGLLLIFGNWEKSSFLMFSKTQTYHAAKIGIEQAIWELKNDKNNYDGYDEAWGQKFSGNEIDIDDDGVNESKFFYVKNFRGKIIARYAVLIKDESGCINLNYSGNISKNNKHSFNEGWSTFEIAFLPEFCDYVANKVVEFRRGNDEKPGKDEKDDDQDNEIISDDGIDNNADTIIDEEGEGIDEEDEFNHTKPCGDDRPFVTIEDIKMVYGMTDKLFKKIKNFITCHSYDLNIDSENYLRTNINSATVSHIASILESQGYKRENAIQIALNIVDYRDKDSIPTVVTTQDGQRFVGIDKTPYLNEIEPCPEIEITTRMTKEGPVITIEEKGPQFIEIFNPYEKPIDIGGWTIKGGMVLLPSMDSSSLNKKAQEALENIEKDTEIDQSVFKQFWQSLTINSIKIPDGTIIKGSSYYLIGDSIRWKIVIKITQKGAIVIPFLIPIKKPSNADQFEPILFMNFDVPILSEIFSFIAKIFGINLIFSGEMFMLDNKNHLIEQTDYGKDKPGKESRQKNDPRINQWFTYLQTPGIKNLCFDPTTGGEFSPFQINQWQASFIIKNNPFSSPAELSYIHKGFQWQTLNMWKNHDNKLLDLFTVVKEPENPFYGRININTADSIVLQCLPLVDTDIARQIIAKRPFKDLSEIVGKYQDPLNDEITKHGSNMTDDNNNFWIDTEDEKELVISKIINLITVRTNVFRILVVSQKVIDSDNNGIINEKEIKAETRYRVIYDRHKNKIIERRKL